MKKSEIRVALDALKEIKLPKIEDKDLRNTIIENHFILLDASRKVDEKVEDNRKVFLAAHKAEEKAVNELKAKIVEATNRDNKVALSKELREKHQCYFDAVDEFNESVDKLYAEGREGVIVLFQAMDAAGKDSTIKHVMSGLNPQGVKVYSFDQGNSTTLGGLLYGAMVNGQSSMVNTLYTGGTTEVSFTASINNDQKISALVTNNGTIAGNSDGSYKLTMNSADAIVTALLANYGVALYNAPGTNDPTNATTIDEHNGQIADVTIYGRTLFKDGSWNTLCLPFNVTATLIEAKDANNKYLTPLHGATIMELDVDGKYDANGSPVENGAYQTGFKDGTLYLYFREVTQMEAGKPYIVRWARDTDVTDPAFGYCRMMSTAAETVTSADGKVSFKGIYDPMTLNGGDASNLYLGAGNQLYYPSENRTMNAFRAYFHVDLTDDDPQGGGQQTVRAFSLHFGNDGETTGIIEAEANSSLFILHSSLSGWHSLEGRKLSGKPTAKGVYIYNGKKRVIK